MNTTRPLSETLQSLLDAGYRLADTHIASLSNEALQSDDWRLDKLSQIRDQDKRAMVLIIAVSSASRGLKLVFVEVLDPASPFTPLQLVRRLFPMDHRPGRPIKGRQVA